MESPAQALYQRKTSQTLGSEEKRASSGETILKASILGHNINRIITLINLIGRHLIISPLGIRNTIVLFSRRTQTRCRRLMHLLRNPIQP